MFCFPFLRVDEGRKIVSSVGAWTLPIFHKSWNKVFFYFKLMPFYTMGYRHMGDFNHIWNECYIKEFSFNKVMWSNFIGIFNFDGIRDHRSHKYKMALI